RLGVLPAEGQLPDVREVPLAQLARPRDRGGGGGAVPVRPPPACDEPRGERGEGEHGSKSHDPPTHTGSEGAGPRNPLSSAPPMAHRVPPFEAFVARAK